MIQRLKKPVKSIWYLIAFVIITFALVLQLGRLAIPYLSDYRTSLEEFASEQLQAKVSFGGLSGSWYGLRPEVTIRGLSVVADDNSPILSIAHARMQLDILSSLIYWVPVWRDLEFQGLRLTVEQNSEGGWSIGGLSANTGQERGWQYRNPGSLFLMAKQVDIESADIDFKFHNNRRVTSSIPQISIQNDGRFHRLNALAVIDDQPVMDFVLEGVGDPSDPDQFFATAYLELKQFPLERVASLFSQVTFSQETQVQAAQALNKKVQEKQAQKQQVKQPESSRDTNVDLKLWFDFASPSRFLMNGQLGLIVEKPTEFAKANYLDIPISADINGDYSIDNGLSFGLRNVKVDQTLTMAPVSFNLHQDKLVVMAETFDLQPWSQWIAKRLLSQEKVKNILNTLSPRGRLDNVRLAVDLLALEQSTIQANIHDGSINHWKNVPGFQQVNAYVESKIKNGFALVETENFQIHPQSLYEQPLSAASAKGYVGWKLSPEKNKAIIYGKQLLVEGEFGQAAGHFDLLIPWKPGSYSGELALQIGIKNSHSDYYEQFLPENFPERLRQWMKESIQEARVNEAGFIYRGGLKKSSNGAIQFYTDFDQGVLRNKDWPTLTNINALLTVDNNRVNALVEEASFYEGDTFSGKVGWNQRGKNHLRINAEGGAPLSSGLRFIKNSWLGIKTDGLFDNWTGDGEIGIRSEISIPILNKNDSPDIKVAVKFGNNKLNLKEQRLDMTDVNGEFFYSSEAGFNSRNLNAKLFSKPFKIQFSGGDAQNNALWLKGSGASSVKSLSDWSGQAVEKIAEGEMRYDFSLNIPLEGKTNQHPELIINSDMNGMVLLLPAPLSKGKADRRDLVVNVALNPETTRYRFSLDKNIAGDITDDKSGALRGRVLVSDRLATDRLTNLSNKKVKSGFVVEGDFKSLNLEAWLNSLNKLADDNSKSTIKQPPISFNINADQARYGDMAVKSLSLSGKRNTKGWLTKVNSSTVKGDIFIPNTSLPIAVTLDYLRFNSKPGNDKKKISDKQLDPMVNVQLSKIKPADITIRDLRYKDKQLGQWSLKLRKDDKGLELRSIKASIVDLKIAGKYENQGAYLRWQFPGEFNPMYTRFVGNLTGGNIKSLFESLNLPPALESQSVNVAMEFEWAGSPANIAVEGLNGKIGVDFKKGVFTQEKANNATGVLKLFGLINFDTWARRIRLDFSDLYKEGLVYDRLTGNINIDKGLVSTKEDIVFKGPSSDFSLRGSVDYPKQEVNGELVATLPISGNLTVATALAAGLPAAAGVYIISKLFKKQVDKVSSITYDITGSLDKPDVKVRTAENTNFVEDNTETDAFNLDDGTN